MKVKTILLALILCLATAFAMVACFDDAGGDQSGSTSGSENESTSVHEHVYTEVGETPSTCVEAGVKKHYKCDGCGKMFIKDGDEYVETTEADLALPLAAHSFTGISVKTNPTKTVYTAFEEFKLDGIEVVKTCSVEGCAGEAVEEAAVTFAYETEGAVKLTANMTKVVIKVADFETELAITVNKIIVKLPVIEGKEYTGEAQVAVVPASELYTVTENNGGTAIGEYDVKLTLVDAVNYAFEGVEGAVATVKFAITKTANEITMPDSIADITCHGEPVISATAKESATITYVYSTSENGEYGAKPESGFIAGTYYVKAIAAETTNYKETVSAPMSFEVKHAVASWNTEDENVDTGVCTCGAALNDVTFNKKVTDVRQDVILSAETKAITLGGISEYKAVKSIKYGELVLGNDIAALTIPEGMSDAVHGEQTLAVVVTDNYDFGHTIEVPVTIITKVISDWGSLLYNCQYNTFNSANGVNVFGAGKYYILGQDIEGSSVYSFSYGGSSYTIAWGGYDKGFAGTLDGRGKTIKNVNVNNGGIFSALCGGTVKNVKVTVAEWSDAYNHFSLFASNVKDTTFSNITITFNKVINLTKPGVLAGQQMFNTRCADVTIYAYGSELGYLLGSAIHADNANNVCDNVFVYAKSLTKISPNQTAKTGVLVTLTKDLTKNNDVILKYKGGDKTSFTIDLENYSDYTVTNVGFDGKAVEFNGTTIAITDEMRNGIHGENSLTVTAVKGNDTVILAVPVTIVTESISTFDRLKELVSIKTTTEAADIKKGKDKYYVLAGDINAGQYAAGAGGSNTTYAGFAGTLDGRGYKLIGGTTGGHGLFGGLYGGTIKNITFEGVTYGGTRWNSLIANNIFGATMEDVTITVANELDMSGIDTDLAEAEWNNRGLIAFGHTQGLKMTNVTIEAKNAKLFTLFGTGSLSCQKGQYTCDRVNVIVKGLKYLGRTANSSLGINEVSNLTVTTAE